MIRAEKRHPNPPRRGQPRGRDSRRSLAWIAGVLLLCGMGGLVPWAARQAGQWLRGDRFALESIAVGGASHLSAGEVAAASAVRAGQRMIDLDLAEIERRLTSHPWIASATLTRLPPGRLLIDISERQPGAVTPTEHGPYFVDASGTAFAPAFPTSQEERVRFELDPPTRPGQADLRLTACVALMKQVAGEDLPRLRSVRITRDSDPRGITMRLAGVESEVVLGRGDVDPKLDRLGRLLRAELPELADARTIDLRFAQRAVLRKDVLEETSGAEDREMRNSAKRGPAG